jgi:hypothetical protein
MPREPRRKLEAAPSVHARRFDDETVILDLARGEYLALDAIGSVLWEGLEAGLSIEDIARRVASEYDVTFERARADLEELTAELVARGLFVEVL